MAHILFHEQLLKKEHKVFYKTYCTKKQMFGIAYQSPAGNKEILPEFMHVYNYGDNGKCAVIADTGDYKWVDQSLTVSNMNEAEENYFTTLYKQNSRCNCFGTVIRCGHCEQGIIRNPMNFLKKELVGDSQTYEYNTQVAVYRVWIKEELELKTRHSHLWEASELENNLQQEIDLTEVADGICNELELEVCLYKYPNLDIDEVDLSSYSIRIEIIKKNTTTTYNE